MTQYYKLTDQNMQTYSGYQWIVGEWKKTSGEGELCGPGWLHCYDDPLLAVLLNPLHADYSDPWLFKIEVAGQEKKDNGLKFGFSEMRLIEKVNLPVLTVEQRVRFGILCALEICKEAVFLSWAEGWLSGTDRSAHAAHVATYAATNTAAYAAGHAARAADNAAESANCLAAHAADNAARAARAADAANAAACAANAAADAAIDLKSIAQKAIEGN